MQIDPLKGKVLLVDKPYKWTSFDVVNKLKWLVKKLPAAEITPDSRHQPPKLKVGHAGTLDPLATGLLIVCVGKETKNIDSYQAQEKEYTGTFFIGATTPCFDLEKPVDQEYPTAHITPEMIHAAAKKFTGTQQQTPPIFSAVKIKGKRAYDIARAGKTAEIEPREISITAFEITRIALPEVDFRVVCSKGTYIRSLARDFGLELGSGAYLSALCRTRIGDFLLKDAWKMEELVHELGGEMREEKDKK